ncbi:hypothetical protein B7463_g5846, partial [Scytalidium lignicola]
MAPSTKRHEEARMDSKRQHISEMPFTLDNWHEHIDWLNTFVVAILPAFGLVAMFYTPLRGATLVWSVFYYFITGLGITAGYHRLWAHRSYKACLPLQIWLAAVGAGAVENSIRRWSRDHRAHHRFTDTDKDPYSVRKGFIYSHMGWLVLKQDPKRLGRSDITDLNRDAVVVWQHKHYVEIALVMGLILPSVVSGLGWGDWVGGLVYAGILRIFFVQQATFCVNSVAHWIGDQPFDDRNSPRDHVLTALLTLGEGYHNFHHEFPSDYRNAIEWYQYDPTKWSIALWKKLGLASDLKTFRHNVIEIGRLQQQQKVVDLKMAQLALAPVSEGLPAVGWKEFERRTNDGQCLIVIAGIIHDVGDFMKDHPGGMAMIQNGIGHDATALFNGSTYSHSYFAHRLLWTLRIGILQDRYEVEVLKPEKQDKITDVLIDDSELPSTINETIDY